MTISIYLDYNVIIDFDSGVDPDLLRLIISGSQSGRIKCLSGPGHLEEIAVGLVDGVLGADEKDRQLQLLSKISRNTSLVPDLNNAVVEIEVSPVDRFHLAVRDRFSNDYVERRERLRQRIFSNTFGNQEISRRMSGMPPEKIFYTEEVRDLIRYLIEKENYNVTFINAGFLKNNMHSYEDIMTASDVLFASLEAVRYHAEKKDKYRSRIYNVMHAIYAMFCDVFCTNDTRLRMKAQAVYAYGGLCTKVVSSKELASLVAAQSASL